MALFDKLTFRDPKFTLQLIALVAVNILAYISGEISVAVAVDGLVLGYHIGNSP